MKVAILFMTSYPYSKTMKPIVYYIYTQYDCILFVLCIRINNLQFKKKYKKFTCCIYLLYILKLFYKKTENIFIKKVQTHQQFA